MTVVVLLLLSSCGSGGQLNQLSTDIDIQFDEHSIIGRPGYFHLGKSTDGQWWFITPEGKPFFYKGVCAVNRAGTAGGRRARDGSYAQVIDEKYGYQASPDSFVNAQIFRLDDWGFNALGAWTTEEFFDRGMPYTEIVECFKEGPLLTIPGDRRPMPDIFDPAWIQAVNSKARTLCATKRTSKDLVGYFTDNEIGFGRSEDIGLDLGFVNTGRFGYSLLRGFLALEEGISARERAWAFIQDRYDDLEALSAGWGREIRSKDDLQELNDKKIPIKTPQYLRDSRDFQLLYAEHYFRTVYETIKRYDPNHLVLGCRFGAPPDTAILRVMTPWVDVISQNNYRPTLYQRIDYLYRYTGLPVLIGEFSWNPDLFKYVTLPHEPEGGYSLKERVFRRGEEVLLRACTHPATVGYTWYRWVANTSEGDRFSFGLVDRLDREEMHIPLLKEIHPKIESLRTKVAEQKDSFYHSRTGTVSITLENMRPNWNHLLNIEIADGVWSSKAFGWQMEGHDIIGVLNPEKGEIELKIEFKEWYWRGKKALDAGWGEYDVKLERQGQYLNGTFQGKYNDRKVGGLVNGYFLPELPVEWSAPTITYE
jgi:hypothetical protein